MRRSREEPTRRGTARFALVQVLVGLAALVVAPGALANEKQDLQRFSDCPYETPGVTRCVYSTTTSGEFVIGKGTVPITRTVTIQGGLNGTLLVPTRDGETLSKTPLPVPGGLVGIELPGNFSEVTATAELAGQAEITTGVTLPVKVKLDNPLLGSGCYIGSNAEPVSLHLTYATTNPPPPNKPISGNLVLGNKDGGDILTLDGTLVDNAFAAPGVNGCTLLPPVGDAAVNAKEGLPAAAGTNTAILSGDTELVSARIVEVGLRLPELGRCEKAAPVMEGTKRVYKGRFTDATCTNEGVPGHYEWSSGPGTGSSFTGSGKSVTLQTSAGVTVSCKTSSTSGDYTGPKSLTATLKLAGCSTGSAPCQSPSAAAGEVRTGTVQGALDFIKEGESPQTPIVGLDVSSGSGPIVSFQCGESSYTLSGSVVVAVTPVDKMTSSFTVAATQSAGKQMPESLEGGPTDTLTLSGPAGEQQAGLAASDKFSNEERLEVKAVR